MPHNGGIFQTGFNFLQIGDCYPFLNFVKAGQTPFIFNIGQPDPDRLDANGYIDNTSGSEEFGTLFYIPKNSDREGRYVVKWDGGGVGTEFNLGWLGTLDEGSNLGANGRFVFHTVSPGEPYTIGRTILIWKNPAPNTRVTNVRFVHEDDEALLDSGEVFSPLFKQLIAEGGYGVIRELDWGTRNTSSLVKWEHRLPVTAISYAGEWLPLELWAGETVKTGTAYAVAKPGFVLEHGAQVVVRWDVDGTVSGSFTFVDTLNVEGTGAIAIANSYGSPETFDDGLLMDAGRYSILTYDADLNKWMKYGGNASSGDKFISPMVPYELLMDLAIETGTHLWVVQPFLSSDPVSNLMPSVATYVMDRVEVEAPWMIPRFELVSNEDWNNGGAFPGTRYGWNKANARWGTSFDTHNYHGRAFSLNAQAIWDALGDTAKNPNKYHLVCGVQTYGSESASAPRLTSALHVADDPVNNKPASNYATHIACANYYGIPTTLAARTHELVLAMDYAAAGTEAERDAIATEFVEMMLEAQPTLTARFVAWKAYAVTHGVDEVVAYEGGYSPDYTSGQLTGNITAIARGATTTITATDRLPTVGLSVSYANVGGTTGLNGNTYTVLSVTSTTYTIDADSSGMGNWTSGGTATYLNTRSPVNTLRAAGRTVPAVKVAARTCVENFYRAGCRWYSKFMFSGDGFSGDVAGQIWAGYFPDIYGTECLEMELYGEMSAEANPINFTIRV